MEIRIFSFGGGVQSMAAMVLSVQGKLPYTHFLFANVGNDSENPDTLAYMTDVAMPYATQHNLTLIELTHTKHTSTLLESLTEDSSRIAIPIHLKGAGPGWRNCTHRWKIEVIDQWCRANAGATKQNRIPIGIGISIDEYQRMRSDDPEKDMYTKKEYPLIDLRISRQECTRIIASAGLPVPPKSSCWFCPYKSDYDWKNLAKQKPELFAHAIALEDTLNAKRKKYGNKDDVYLWNKQRPLRTINDDSVMDMFDDDQMSCESGHCMT